MGQEHRGVAVSHEVCHSAHVHTGRDHLRAEGVAQIIGADTAGYPGPAQGIRPCPAYPVQRLAVVADKIVHAFLPVLIAPCLEHGYEAFPDGHLTPWRFQVLLGSVDAQDAALQVNVLPCQGKELRAANTHAKLGPKDDDPDDMRRSMGQDGVQLFRCRRYELLIVGRRQLGEDHGITKAVCVAPAQDAF